MTASVGDSTHFLHCTHVIGRSTKHYLMRCILLGKMKSGKCKVLVFGERNRANAQDKRRIRYVGGWRLTAINRSEKALP